MNHGTYHIKGRRILFDIKQLIGETTDYDKKKMLEEKSQKAGAKVSAPSQIPLEEP